MPIVAISNWSPLVQHPTIQHTQPEIESFQFEVEERGGGIEVYCDVCHELNEFPTRMANRFGLCFNCNSPMLVPASKIAAKARKGNKERLAGLSTLLLFAFVMLFVKPVMGAVLLGVWSILALIHFCQT
ncbi:MAG: hypothetical protein JSS27_15410 [Planctomycetes bacterium]|nr:hypothetical protein [Planctomycetota bacterium]